MHPTAALASLLFAAAVTGQSTADLLAVAQQHLEAERWQQAFSALQQVADAADATVAHPEVARLFRQCAEGLLRSDQLDAGMEALACELAFTRRVHGGADHETVAALLGELAAGNEAVKRWNVALPLRTEGVAMRRRLAAGADRPDISTALTNLGHCLRGAKRFAEAVQAFEEALAMDVSLHGDTPHEDVASSLGYLGSCLAAMGRHDEALRRLERQLVVYRQVHGDGDHPAIVLAANNVAFLLVRIGRHGEALALYESSLAMRKRLVGPFDHSDVAQSLNDIGLCLLAIGRPVDALPRFEAGLAMQQRLHGSTDHPDLAGATTALALCLQTIGRHESSLGMFESALAMRRRLCGDRDDPAVAKAIGGLGWCLQRLGRSEEALRQFEAALAMRERLGGAADDPELAEAIGNVGWAQVSLGNAVAALPRFEAALAMNQRLHGERDHRHVAVDLHNLASCLEMLGRLEDASVRYGDAAAMFGRLFAGSAHPDFVACLGGLSRCARLLGRRDEALRASEQACDMVDRLRADSRVAAAGRQSFFDELKRTSTYERLQRLAVESGAPATALLAAERSRGRELLDLCEQQRFDPMDEAERRARARGDDTALVTLVRLRQDLQAVRVEADRVLQQIGSAPDEARAELQQRSLAVQQRQRQLQDEEARLLADVLPMGRVRTVAEIRSALAVDEILLEYTVTPDVAFVYVVTAAAEVEAIALPRAHAAVQRAMAGAVLRHAQGPLPARGRDPAIQPQDADAVLAENRELFASLVPATLWPRLQKAACVFVAAHRELHRLPFELLVTGVKDGAPVHWLDDGPPVAYVPSGSLLHWMRQRSRDAKDDVTALGLLAIGDPAALSVAPTIPEEGVYVLAVHAGGEGARTGILPRDVLLSYDGRSLADDASLRDARTAVEAAIEDGKRDGAPIVVEVWRAGGRQSVEVRPGPLGLTVGRGKARSAFEASLGVGDGLVRITRAGDLERLGDLPPLKGARAETAAIEAVFAERGNPTRLLVGSAATEPAVFAQASKAKYLHFACHGIAEEYVGQSLSMLVLSQPTNVLPDDDGLLKLEDLLQRWRGHLASSRLVVLSACRTNVGPTRRDEAPQALPIGFLFAGVPAVVSSLWAVDDESTRVLMTDFYARLLEGETDHLAAFTAAKKALRAKYPDPFHWAPFLFLGSPE